MIKLTANGKRIDTAPIERLLTQGESFSDRICIQIDSVNNDVDVSECIFVMRTAASDGSMTETLLTKEIQEEVILLTWDVADTVTAVAGSLRLELVGTKDDSVIIKYRMPPVYIKEAVMGTNIPVPDVVEVKLAEMNALLEDSKNSSNQEVIDARTGCFSDYTYASLQQRLNAELGACVRQSQHEQNIAALTQKDADLQNAINSAGLLAGQNSVKLSDLEEEIAAARYGYIDTAGETRKQYDTLDARVMGDFIHLWDYCQDTNTELCAARTPSISQAGTQSSLGGRLGADFAAVSSILSSSQQDIAENTALTASSLGMQKKNLLKNTATTTTTNGVTFTVNDDGSVTVNGTATDTAFFNIPYTHTGEARSVILSGCPEGGSGDTYMFRADKAGTVVARDYGEGSAITADVLATVTYVAIRIQSGYTADNLVFYPMIRYADIADSTYETYTPSLQEQIDELRSQIAAMTAGN